LNRDNKGGASSPNLAAIDFSKHALDYFVPPFLAATLITHSKYDTYNQMAQELSKARPPEMAFPMKLNAQMN